MRVTTLSLLLLAILAGCTAPAKVPEPCVDQLPNLPITGDLVADAGPDFDAKPGARISFDASASFDAKGGEFTFVWGQVHGPCAPLDLTDPSHPKVKVPHVHADDAVLVYRLHLVQGETMSAGDEAEIAVRAD